MAVRAQTLNTRSADGDSIWKTTDTFNSSYYSGLDSRIYAGDVFLDEIISLEYRMQEAVMPLFDYAAYTWNTVVHGSRRVEGSFTINFKRNGYLFELLRQLRKESTAQDLPVQSGRLSDAFRVARNGSATIEQFVALAAGDGTAARDGSGRPKFDPTLLGQVATDFERAIWGGSLQSTSPNPRVSTAAQELISETSDRQPRFRVEGEWDLNIRFGSALPEGDGRKQKIGANARLPEEKDRIVIGTGSRIIRVALTNLQRLVDDSGRPCLESMTFVARDVI
jgi:hypothetical protein